MRGCRPMKVRLSIYGGIIGRTNSKKENIGTNTTMGAHYLEFVQNFTNLRSRVSTDNHERNTL